MRVTEVRMTLVGDGGKDGLLAYCTVSFDREFVVHDVKLVRLSGRYLVSMPSRRISGHCLQCREMNHVRAEFCNRCGGKFDKPLLPCVDPNLEPRMEAPPGRESRYFVDLAHPISRRFRSELEDIVVEEYLKERRRLGRQTEQPGRPEEAAAHAP